MGNCETCKANKICDHNKYGFENCGNYIPKNEIISLLSDLKKNVHNTAHYPRAKDILPFISLKAFDAILNNYFSKYWEEKK